MTTLRCDYTRMIVCVCVCGSVGVTINCEGVQRVGAELRRNAAQHNVVWCGGWNVCVNRQSEGQVLLISEEWVM